MINQNEILGIVFAMVIPPIFTIFFGIWKITSPIRQLDLSVQKFTILIDHLTETDERHDKRLNKHSDFLDYLIKQEALHEKSIIEHESRLNRLETKQ
ncbi:MAG: hypothetical protein GXZ11_05560 [Tissierellia bacterium]|nr:hypothetical protein [Tissierellia bacterium]